MSSHSLKYTVCSERVQPRFLGTCERKDQKDRRPPLRLSPLRPSHLFFFMPNILVCTYAHLVRIRRGDTGCKSSEHYSERGASLYLTPCGIHQDGTTHACGLYLDVKIPAQLPSRPLLLILICTVLRSQQSTEHVHVMCMYASSGLTICCAYSRVPNTYRHAWINKQ